MFMWRFLVKIRHLERAIWQCSCRRHLQACHWTKWLKANNNSKACFFIQTIGRDFIMYKMRMGDINFMYFVLGFIHIPSIWRSKAQVLFFNCLRIEKKPEKWGLKILYYLYGITKQLAFESDSFGRVIKKATIKRSNIKSSKCLCQS